MRKFFFSFAISLALLAVDSFAQSVFVYRNDDIAPFTRYEGVQRMQCSKLSVDSVTQNTFVTQEIETADQIHRFPLHTIDSIAFQAPAIPESFPKKHLIEEFTGQACGYCPYGMDCIRDFMKGDDNWVLILHHYGYNADRFTVTGSKTITNALGVSGAPNMTINRAKTNYGEGNTIVFHPGYLIEDVAKSQFDATTYASVVINNTYDPQTRQLNVNVSGAICKEDYPALQLTVLVKESGMIDTQQDYYNTFEGWAEFRHANAVRVFLSAAKGDAVNVDASRHYSATYTTTLNSKWVPENCMIVAFLSEAFQPVVQVEQQPVVKGTTGGADIEHEGIRAVEVPDYYPEPDATNGPAYFSGNKSETLTTTYAYSQDYPEEGFRFWQLQTYNASAYTTVSGTKSIPFANIFLFTEVGASAIPAGEYPVNSSLQPGTVYAGFRDDSSATIDGSQFYFISYSYFLQNYLLPKAEWLIVDGTLTVNKDRTWLLNGHTRNGAEIHLTGSAISVAGSANAPKPRMPRL